MKKFLFPLPLLLMIALLTGCSTMRIIDAAEDQITREQAAEIALTHAGYTPQQVQFLRTEFEIDDRIPEYSVDFYANGLEYEYEIHAESGAILSCDTDR